MSVSIAEIVAGVRAGEASLVAESAGYIVLGLADSAAKLPRAFAPNEVGIDEQGDIVSAGVAGAAPDQAERRIRRLLGWMLAEARTPSPNLRRVADRSDLVGLSHLVVELEAALVPVNRKAARRSLARLCRDTTRALERGVREAADFEVEATASAVQRQPVLQGEPVLQREPAVPGDAAVQAAPAQVAVQAAPSAVVASEAEAQAQGRRESIPPAPMKSSRSAPHVGGPVVVEDGRFDALRKLAGLRAAEAKAIADDGELDVEVEVELTPLILSAVAPRVAPISRTPALPAAWPVGEYDEEAAAALPAAPSTSTANVDGTAVAGRSSVRPVVRSVLTQRALAPEVPALDVPTREVLEVNTPQELIDTTPTTVLAQVVETPEQGPALNLFAPTPVSSVVDTQPEPSAPELPRRSPSESPHRPSDVNDLLARFGSVARTNDRELLRGLERLSGVERGSVSRGAAADPEECLRPSPVVALR